jgi:hypothetical protein
MEKKRILKEDGRYLVYYHFPNTATPAESSTFAEIDATSGDAANRPAPPVPASSEEQSHV